MHVSNEKHVRRQAHAHFDRNSTLTVMVIQIIKLVRESLRCFMTYNFLNSYPKGLTLNDNLSRISYVYHDQMIYELQGF